MTSARPTTITQYIEAAPAAGRPHLHRLHALLKSVAPDADEAIKWGTPFFIEPRFLFAFSAHKAHLSFAPTAAAMAEFASELAKYKTTKGTLQLPYDQPLPEDLVRRMAQYCVQELKGRESAGFWQ